MRLPFWRLTGKNAAQVEAHEKWYQNLQRLRREQRQELDEWKRQKKQQEEEERKQASTECQQQQESDAWVAQWRRQREAVRQRLNRWKVCCKIIKLEVERLMDEPTCDRIQLIK